MSTDRQFKIKMEGSAVADNSISFKLLASILNGVQQTFHYIALAETKKDLRKVGRIPADILQACELRRVIERAGSYEIVAEVADIFKSNLFTDIDLGLLAAEKYLDLIKCVGCDNNEGEIYKLFPDSVHRRRILRSVESYCPKEGDEWSIVFDGKSQSNNNILLNKDARKQISRYINYPAIDTRTVTGELMRIHLDEHKLSIREPLTGRMLDCFYDPEIEEFIIGNLKGIIQVTGRFQLDANNEVEKVIDVREISELDLSPIRLSMIDIDDCKLILKEPLVLEPIFDGQSLVFEFPEFNVISEGLTRNDAIKSFESDLVWLWKEYALADDIHLSGDAIEVKNKLINMIKQV